MKATREIPKQAWKQFFAMIDAHLPEHRARIEVDSAELGAQVESENAQIRSIDLVDKGSMAGAVEIEMGGVDRDDDLDDHRIIKAVRLMALEGEGGTLECLEIEDQEGSNTIIRFFEPLMLPQFAGGTEAQPSV